MPDSQASQSTISGFIQRRMTGAPQRTSPQVQFSGLNKAVKSYEGQQVPGVGITSLSFGEPSRYEKQHLGIDIAGPGGTKIPAFVGGTVVGETLGHKPGEKGFGNRVIIKDDMGNTHFYSHLSNAWVKTGARVAKGEIIGSSGKTGSTYSESGGPTEHLDYRILSAAQKWINPAPYVGLK